jgi:hypothetical protein
MQLRYYAVMRRLGVALAGLAVLFVCDISARADTAVDELEKDLNDVKATQQATSDQSLSDFLAQTLAASQDSNTAFQLYQTAGGAVPDGAPIQSHHAHETAEEKGAREAQDSVLMGPIALVAQLHCGMLHFAVLYATSPNQKGLHDDFVAWLKTTPDIFNQIKDDDLKQAGRNLKRSSMKESVIASYFSFFNWGNVDQAGWTIYDIPKLYRSEVLDPLRTTPTADTLAAWDVYIGLRNTSEPDGKKWNVVEYPAMMFDRGVDDYAVEPSMEKLQVLVDLIKANSACPTVKDMISKTHDLVADYRKRHPSAATPQAETATASGATSSAPDPNVKVTTTTQGDMTIITTQTNTATTTPPAPPPQ